jgi:hypothetical protein
VDINDLEKSIKNWLYFQNRVSGGKLTITIDLDDYSVSTIKNARALESVYLDMEAKSFFKKYIGSCGGSGTPMHGAAGLLC